MQSGELNKRITIRKITSSDDSINSPVPQSTDYIKPWAKVYVRSGDIRNESPSGLLYTTEFTIRYNSLSKNINNEYEVFYNGKTYSIIEAFEVGNKEAMKIIGTYYGN